MKCSLERSSGNLSKGDLCLTIEGKFSAKDTPFQTFLHKHRLPLVGSVEVPARASYDAFVALAATGELFYNDKKLLIDLYGKTQLVYRVAEGRGVTGELHVNGKILPLAEVALIGNGAPHWYLHGMTVRFIHTEIFWSDLARIAHTPEKVSISDIQSDDPDAPKVIFEGNAQNVVEIAAKPLPVLKLHDRTGAFADLWVKYPQGSIVPFHEPVAPSGVKRDFKAEGEWEKDLLETGFQKKLVGRSHYFCPMDKVAKTLSFLLDLGWSIEDAQMRKIVRQNQQHLSMDSQGDVIRIKGKVEFGEHTANLQDVYGAFTRRERFIELGKNEVGLLDHEGLEGFSDVEVVTDKEGALVVHRNAFASLGALFEKGGDVMIDAPLQNLKNLLEALPEPSSAALPATFLGTLRPYQQQGVEWLNRLQQLRLHGLLADDMGLGKTVQVIAFLSQNSPKKPTLIIVPTTLIFNWVKEFERFLPSRKIVVHQGAQRAKESASLLDADVIISTYTTVRIDLGIFRALSFAHLILDEAQAIKNDQTQIAQALYQLQADFRLSMTGTPIENRFSELWAHFRFLIPDLFDSVEKFESDAAIDSRRLKRKVRPFILRRNKCEVAKDLPEKIEQVVWVEMGEAQRALYEGFLAKIKGSVKKKSSMEILEAILRLRQLCCHPMLLSQLLDDDAPLESAKFSALFADLETLLAEQQKVLVYSQFTSMLALMIKEASARGWKFSVLDGSTKDREAQVRQFQEDPDIQLFFISLKAGGAGLNLTAADAVLLYDPWWNEAVERQAIDRVHRMGRAAPVLAKRYIVQESVEEKMMKIKQSKNQLASDILEEDLSSLRLTAEELEFLLL